MKSSTILALLGLSSFTSAWLPSNRSLNAFYTKDAAPTGKVRRWLYGNGKIRGVNLGAMFISEPWMQSDEWSDTMGCGSACSEFDCMLALGQDAGNAAFQAHWASWITPDDLDKMSSLGLNTIRIPLGYWINEDLVDSSEHFPQGALTYLDAIVSKASDLGFFVIIDFHGAPYAQDAKQPFTGQCSSTAGFYQTSQYERAYEWLSWMTNRIHTTDAYSSVGIIEVLNEPATGGDMTDGETNSMTQEYYPNALKAVRDAESSLGISGDKALHVQFMDKLWNAGDPKSNLPSDDSVAFDDHEYINGANPGGSPDDYMSYACGDDRTTDGDSPKIVGEFSLAINGDYQDQSDFDPQSQKDFYSNYFAAQIQAYEATLGWVFWGWKVNWSQYGDYRWDYQAAVSNGVIPDSSSGLDDAISSSVC